MTELALSIHDSLLLLTSPFVCSRISTFVRLSLQFDLHSLLSNLPRSSCSLVFVGSSSSSASSLTFSSDAVNRTRLCIQAES
jgi:hypothetical protein